MVYKLIFALVLCAFLIPSSKTEDAKVITGRLVDKNGVGIYSASMAEKGSTNGARADNCGGFRIEYKNSNSVIEINWQDQNYEQRSKTVKMSKLEKKIAKLKNKDVVIIMLSTKTDPIINRGSIAEKAACKYNYKDQVDIKL